MFDTPDLAPLCAAPLVSVIVGVLIYGILGVIIDVHKSMLIWLHDMTTEKTNPRTTG